jgi:hypothetical protein
MYHSIKSPALCETHAMYVSRIARMQSDFLPDDLANGSCA